MRIDVVLVLSARQGWTGAESTSVIRVIGVIILFAFKHEVKFRAVVRSDMRRARVSVGHISPAALKSQSAMVLSQIIARAFDNRYGSRAVGTRVNFNFIRVNKFYMVIFKVKNFAHGHVNLAAQHRSGDECEWTPPKSVGPCSRGR